MNTIHSFLKKPAVVFVVIIIIATFFRLYNLSSTPPGLYPDEAMNGNNALEVLHTGQTKVFYPENNGREGLFINIQALFVKTLHNEPWVLRLVSALFGILTVAGVWALMKTLLDKSYIWAVHAGAFFTAISFWHINFSRIGFRAIMAPAFLVWALYFASFALKKDGWRITALLAIIGGFLYGLGMHSYIAYRATPLLIIIFFLFARRYLSIPWKKVAGILALFVVASLVAFAPLGIYFLEHPADFLGRTSQVSVLSSPAPLKNLASNIAKTLIMFNIKGDGNWRHNFANKPELFWPVGILFLLGVVVSLFSLRKKQFLSKQESFVAWTSLWWIGVGLLPVIISNEGIPHALRAILVIPPIFMLAGIATHRVVLFSKRHLGGTMTIAGTMLIGVVLCLNSYTTYFIAWGENVNTQGAFSSSYVELGQQLNLLSPQLAKYVVVNAGGVEVRGIPMPAQTVMFITDTFLPPQQEQKNIHYILPAQESSIPQNSLVFYLEPK